MMSKTIRASRLFDSKLIELMKTISNSNHFSMHGCFKTVVPTSWKLEYQINHDLHLIFIKSGKGSYYFEDVEVPLEKGAIVFVSNNLIHRSTHDINNPPSVIAVRFGLYENTSSKMVQLPCEPFYTYLKTFDIQKYQMMFENLFNCHNFEKNDFKNIQCGSIMNLIICKMLDDFAGSGNAKPIDGRIEKARLFIDNNPDLRITVDKLADMVGLSKQYFRKVFEAHCGMNPKEYQVRMRINYSRFLLEQSSQSIKQVALTLGYRDQYSFSKQFKQVMGYSPSEFRNITRISQIM